MSGPGQSANRKGTIELRAVGRSRGSGISMANNRGVYCTESGRRFTGEFRWLYHGNLTKEPEDFRLLDIPRIGRSLCVRRSVDRCLPGCHSASYVNATRSPVHMRACAKGYASGLVPRCAAFLVRPMVHRILRAYSGALGLHKTRRIFLLFYSARDEIPGR